MAGGAFVAAGCDAVVAAGCDAVVAGTDSPSLLQPTMTAIAANNNSHDRRMWTPGVRILNLVPPSEV